MIMMMMTMMAMTKIATPTCMRTEDYTPNILPYVGEEVFVEDGELLIGAVVNDLAGYFVSSDVVVGATITGGRFDELEVDSFSDTGVVLYYCSRL